ncbi:MAG: transglutaminase family protein, partial [bacterium]|nr:transglutaminase family protein [bacterium]
MSAKATSSIPPRKVMTKDGIAPEIVELAGSLDNSPAQIFSYVHDNIRFDPKWGAFKGPLGALWEKSGTSWDQAWLLRDLLTAAGVDARFEWGEIQISTEVLTNITGLDDPWRAGDLLTTAGVPILLLAQGSQVIGARMSHVWVKGYVDYIPNRGVTPGSGDSWIRMDPSLKRHAYAPGIRIHDQVPFSLGGYLQS